MPESAVVSEAFTLEAPVIPMPEQIMLHKLRYIHSYVRGINDLAGKNEIVAKLDSAIRAVDRLRLNHITDRTITQLNHWMQEFFRLVRITEAQVSQYETIISNAPAHLQASSADNPMKILVIETLRKRSEEVNEPFDAEAVDEDELTDTAHSIKLNLEAVVLQIDRARHHEENIQEKLLQFVGDEEDSSEEELAGFKRLRDLSDVVDETVCAIRTIQNMSGAPKNNFALMEAFEQVQRDFHKSVFAFHSIQDRKEILRRKVRDFFGLPPSNSPSMASNSSGFFSESGKGSDNQSGYDTDCDDDTNKTNMTSPESPKK